MAIALVIDNPEGSQEIYENVRAQLGLEGVRAGSSMRPGQVRTAAGACSKYGGHRRTHGDSVKSASCRPSTQPECRDRPAGRRSGSCTIT